MFLSIVMPAFNEAANIATVLDEHIAVAKRLAEPVKAWEIVCLDDGSSDRTASVVRHASDIEPRLRLIVHDRNMGIYRSFTDLYHAARGTHIYATGSDGQWPAENLPSMLDAIGKGADLVVGQRINRSSVYTKWRQVVSYLFNAIPTLLFGVSTGDAGSVKLGIADIFRLPTTSRSPFAEAERIVLAARLGHRITFVPIRFRPRTGGRALGAKFPLVLASCIDCVKVLFLYWGSRLFGRSASHAQPHS